MSDIKPLPAGHIEPLSSALMIPQDAADYLNLSVDTLAEWRCRGGGPIFHKLGRAVRYRLSDLDAWLAKRSFSNTTQSKRDVA